MTTEWDRTSPIQDHIAELQNISCHLQAASAASDVKLEASTLLASLPDTPYWNAFTTTIANAVKQDEVTFEYIERRVIAEESCTHLEKSAHVLWKNNTPGKHCMHHGWNGHNSEDCKDYIMWVEMLRNRKWRRWKVISDFHSWKFDGPVSFEHFPPSSGLELLIVVIWVVSTLCV